MASDVRFCWRVHGWGVLVEHRERRLRHRRDPAMLRLVFVAGTSGAAAAMFLELVPGARITEVERLHESRSGHRPGNPLLTGVRVKRR